MGVCNEKGNGRFHEETAYLTWDGFGVNYVEVAQTRDY